MITIRRLLLPLVVLELSSPGLAILFGGSSGCCCSCGIPMPPSCGCPQLPQIQLPICPPPLPCPPPACPVCQVCPPPQPCPPPPVAVCPAPQPVYVQPNCGCGSGTSGGLISGPPLPGPGAPVQGAAYLGGPQSIPEVSPPFAQPFPQTGAIPQGSYSEGQQPQAHIQTDAQAAQADAAPVPDSAAEQQSPPTSTPSPTPSSEAGRRARGAVTISENKCNSVVLEDLLSKNIDEMDPVASKRAIHKAAQENIRDAVIDIICSDAGFTYIVSTSEYCEAQKEKVICFVYKKP